MLTVRTLMDTTFEKYGEIVRDLLNKALAKTGKTLSVEEMKQEFVRFSEPQGGAYMFVTDLSTPVGVAGFCKLHEKTGRFVYWYIATNVDPRTPAVLLEQVFRKAVRLGYDKLRLTSAQLSDRSILGPVIQHAKIVLQGKPLEFSPSQEFFDIPLQ